MTDTTRSSVALQVMRDWRDLRDRLAKEHVLFAFAAMMSLEAMTRERGRALWRVSHNRKLRAK